MASWIKMANDYKPKLGEELLAYAVATVLLSPATMLMLAACPDESRGVLRPCAYLHAAEILKQK
jgi:hypothetical protein